MPYAGPVQVRFGGRTCFVGAYVMGDAPLVGAIALEDLDLLVDPLRGRLVARHAEGPVGVVATHFPCSSIDRDGDASIITAID